MFDWVDENKKNEEALSAILTTPMYKESFETVFPQEYNEAAKILAKDKEKFDASGNDSEEELSDESEDESSEDAPGSR
jgi:cytochrome c peroxidase